MRGGARGDLKGNVPRVCVFGGDSQGSEGCQNTCQSVHFRRGHSFELLCRL